VSGSFRIAVIGDVHLLFGPADVEALDAGGYDLVLFVGDLAGYRHGGGIEVARHVARLRTPALVVPGNHDGVQAAQLAAELLANDVAAVALESGPFAGGQASRVEALRAALAPAVLGGYSLHAYEARSTRLDVIVARPHSFGGPRLAFRPYLERAFGVASLEASARTLCALVDRASAERIVILAHNGPTGLGDRRDAIWGCDFRRSEGDFGDPDLRIALDHAARTGKRVVAVIAGHMHHAVRGGGVRTWRLARDGVLHVNAARVPRVFRREDRELRHHVCVEIREDGAVAEEILVPS
jgi:uncharacterized protein (TIGR04168 family)